MAEGSFEFADNDTGENFNLKPRDIADPIPEDQRQLNHEVYEARNVLKLIRERGGFAGQDDLYNEFIARVTQAAEVGCTAKNVKTRLAADALEQIRRDIVRRKGRAIKFRYLAILGGWAAAGLVVSGLIVLLSMCYVPALTGYGWVTAGSMVGAWLSLASTRRQISFETIQDVVNVGIDPIIKLVFVGLLASIVALLLQLNVISLSLGTIDLAKFDTETGYALLLGLATGISERAATVQVIERIRGTFVPSQAQT